LARPGREFAAVPVLNIFTLQLGQNDFIATGPYANDVAGWVTDVRALLATYRTGAGSKLLIGLTTQNPRSDAAPPSRSTGQWQGVMPSITSDRTSRHKGQRNVRPSTPLAHGRAAADRRSFLANCFQSPAAARPTFHCTVPSAHASQIKIVARHRPDYIAGWGGRRRRDAAALPFPGLEEGRA
jgi:hypothetical protein